MLKRSPGCASGTLKSSPRGCASATEEFLQWTVLENPGELANTGHSRTLDCVLTSQASG